MLFRIDIIAKDGKSRKRFLTEHYTERQARETFQAKAQEAHREGRDCDCPHLGEDVLIMLITPYTLMGELFLVF